MTDDTLLRTGKRGVLATLKRDGRPQLSNVAYHYADGLIRISVTDGLAKTCNLRRDPRASFHVTTENLAAYVVAEGTAELSPVAADEHDDVVEELVELYRTIWGDHPDWDEYRAAMVADRRLLIRLPVDRLYGYAP
jgi:PPOX class probable F420-dependent enzyme